MAKVILCRGIQGSGKTTWARRWVLEDPEHRVRFNNDDIRNMLGQYWVPKREKLVKALYAEFMAQAVEYGYDIVVDNMNLSTETVNEIKQLVEFVNSESKYHYTIEFKDFWTPVEECIRRDAARPNPIGEAVIINTYNRYKSIIEGQNDTARNLCKS